MIKPLPIALWVLLALGAYCVYLAILYLLQGSLVYPGTRLRERPPLQPGRENREIVWLETGFGRVEAWLLPPRPGTGPPEGGPVPAVIVGHGNYELIDSMPDGFLGFRERGYAVLLVEYPGYGDSAGEPSLETVTETFVAAYDALVSRPGIDAERVLALGRSLGGGAVCALAAERPLAGLILVATFADLPSLSHRYLAPSFLTRDRYDNAAVLRSFAGPVLVVHGSHDGLIPHRHGERLADAAPRGRLISYPSDHDECPPDWGVFWTDVDGFLTEGGLMP